MRTHPLHRTSGLLAAVLCCIAPFSSVVADHEATTTMSTDEQTVTVIKTPSEVLARQKLPNFVGISAETVGARGLSMNLVVIPPGAAAEPHSHKDFESAVYVLEGRVETRYGPGLEESVITETGDFLFIPPACRTSRSI